MPDNDIFYFNITWPGPGEKCPICRTNIKADGACNCRKCKRCNTIFAPALEGSPISVCLCKAGSTNEATHA